MAQSCCSKRGQLLLGEEEVVEEAYHLALAHHLALEEPYPGRVGHHLEKVEPYLVVGEEVCFHSSLHLVEEEVVGEAVLILLTFQEGEVVEEVHNLEEVGEVAHITASDNHTSPITV